MVVVLHASSVSPVSVVYVRLKDFFCPLRPFSRRFATSFFHKCLPLPLFPCRCSVASDVESPFCLYICPRTSATSPRRWSSVSSTPACLDVLVLRRSVFPVPLSPPSLSRLSLRLTKSCLDTAFCLPPTLLRFGSLRHLRTTEMLRMQWRNWMDIAFVEDRKSVLSLVSGACL